MSDLFSFTNNTVDHYGEIESKIRHRRVQMLIHSCIYYKLNDGIVSDHTWQKWADELTELQNKNPEKCNIGFFDEYFVEWDGSTGYHLPHDNNWVLSKSIYAMQLAKVNGNKT